MSPVYLHLLVNPFPVTVTVIGVAMLAYAVARGNESLMRTGLALFFLAALLAMAAFVTGARAGGVLQEMPGASGRSIDRHHALARITTLALVVLGAASMVALAAFRRGRLPRRVAILILAAALAPAAALVWTAGRGGRIRRPELRPAAPSADRPRAPAAHAEEIGIYEP
jgi:uncharacterized membrane protein